MISETTPIPKPGSDEISRAYEEGWIGHNGYQRANGDKQRWAIAFIGDTYSLQGEIVAEILLLIYLNLLRSMLLPAISQSRVPKLACQRHLKGLNNVV